MFRLTTMKEYKWKPRGAVFCLLEGQIWKNSSVSGNIRKETPYSNLFLQHLCSNTKQHDSLDQLQNVSCHPEIPILGFQKKLLDK